MKLIKHISPSEVNDLADLLDYQEGRVVSCTLAQRPEFNLTLFAFAQGEGLSTHQSSGDALIQLLEGTGEFSVEDKKFQVPAGKSILLPAGKPHAVHAAKAFKMLLTVVKPAVGNY